MRKLAQTIRLRLRPLDEIQYLQIPGRQRGSDLRGLFRSVTSCAFLGQDTPRCLLLRSRDIRIELQRPRRVLRPRVIVATYRGHSRRVRGEIARMLVFWI